LVTTYLGDQLIGHISRDGTVIEAREKPMKKHRRHGSRSRRRSGEAGWEMMA
jgi:hypothetical protein